MNRILMDMTCRDEDFEFYANELQNQLDNPDEDAMVLFAYQSYDKDKQIPDIIRSDKIMRTVEEIRDYLNIGTANEVEESLVINAIEIEKKYETELTSGNYGYGIEADFVSSPFILEDEDEVKDLIKIDQIGGIVFYKKLYR